MKPGAILSLALLTGCATQDGEPASPPPPRADAGVKTTTPVKGTGVATGTATAVTPSGTQTIATGTATASAVGIDAATGTLVVPVAEPNPGPLGATWESGLQQCDKNGMKIGYRFWKLVEPYQPGVRHWRVFFRVWAEDKKTVGSGWKRVPKLEYVQMTYSYPTGPSHTRTELIGHPNKEWHNGMLAEGYEWDAFTSVSIRVVRSGGPSGLQVVWPGGQCTT